MRADRLLRTLLTFLAILAIGYVIYTLSASVHPGPAPPSSAMPARAQERDE
jgi:hypothetical protein